MPCIQYNPSCTKIINVKLSVFRRYRFVSMSDVWVKYKLSAFIGIYSPLTIHHSP